MKRWEEREGKERGKERESRGCTGGMVGGLEGSKPQNCDVILLRVCAERFCCWATGGSGVAVKAGWAGQPCKPRPPPVMVRMMIVMMIVKIVMIIMKRIVMKTWR